MELLARGAPWSGCMRVARRCSVLAGVPGPSPICVPPALPCLPRRASPTSTALWATCTTSTAKSATPVGLSWRRGLGWGKGRQSLAASSAAALALAPGRAHSRGLLAHSLAPAPHPAPRPAVPPPLAAALGRELRKALEKKAEAEREKALAA